MGESEAAMGQLIKLSGLKHVIGIRAPQKAPADESPRLQEGVQVIGADRWQSAGFLGKGIKVGVIDPGGFNGLLNQVGSSLPEREHIFTQPGYTLEQLNETPDNHGTGCAEIVAAVAPGVDLYLAYTGGDNIELGNAVDWMLSNQVRIISHSSTGMVGPRDGTGEMVDIVNKAVQQGVVWVNSSGNAAKSHLNMTFTDTDQDGWHEFPDGAEVLKVAVAGGERVFSLTWDDQWFGAQEDYDLYILTPAASGSGYDVATSARDVQEGRPQDRPVEFISFAYGEDQVTYLAVKGTKFTRPGHLNLLGDNSTEFASWMAEGSVKSPCDAFGILCTGATNWRDDSLEEYSCQGPTVDGRNKPDISAPDQVNTVAFGEFPGTSASTPHVAGAAALVLSAFPTFSGGDVINYLQQNALDLGPAGMDNQFGAGRLQFPAPPEGGPPPAPQPTGNSVVIQKIWQEQNVFVSGSKGMNIHVAFDISNAQDQPGTLTALFFNQDTGQPLPDQNGSYATSDRQVAVYQDFTPAYPAASFTDFSLFIPYNELDLPSGEYRLYFVVSITNKSSGAELARSQPNTFTFSQLDQGALHAEFSNIQVSQDVLLGEVKGMEIKVSFNVNGFKGREGQLIAYLYYDAPGNQPLRDVNSAYNTPAGQVAVSQFFVPESDTAAYTDTTLFIPYRELHLSPGPRYPLKLYVSIQDTQTWAELASSDWVKFYYQP
jgi:subtilisin family serine protease